MFLNLEDKAAEDLCFWCGTPYKIFLVKIFWMGIEEKEKKMKQLPKPKEAILKETAVN